MKDFNIIHNILIFLFTFSLKLKLINNNSFKKDIPNHKMKQIKSWIDNFIKTLNSKNKGQKDGRFSQYFD